MNLKFLSPLKKYNFISEYQMAPVDKRKIFFIEEFQLINVAEITALENHHFATPNGKIIWATTNSCLNK